MRQGVKIPCFIFTLVVTGLQRTAGQRTNEVRLQQLKQAVANNLQVEY